VLPRDELARECGLAVAARGGVIVDDDMRTSDPSIYAVGDCACHAGRTYGLVAPGFAMAETLCGVLHGKRKPFRRGDSSCELKLMGIPVAAVGNYEVDARLVTWRAADGLRTLLVRERRLVGATAVGSWDELPRVRALAEQEKRISDRVLLRFEQTGRLFADDEPGIASWPAAAVVCNCRRVTKGELLQCVQSCGPDLAAISARSGAGSVCGSCKPLLLELVGRKAPPAAAPYSRALSVASVGVLALVAVLLVIPSLPFADSVQSPLHALDRVRLDELYRQATGFVLVGFAALSLLLSLRKRTTWLGRLPFGGARALHALLGGLSLVALVTHTGLRMGSSLNFALFLSFVSAGLFGAIAGWASAAEGGTHPRRARQGRRVRRPMTLLHMLVLWPLPVLLGLHVFAAYYF
jgi:nitrite reductase (NADH) large subunit